MSLVFTQLQIFQPNPQPLKNPKSQNKSLIHISTYLFLIEIEESIQKKYKN